MLSVIWRGRGFFLPGEMIHFRCPTPRLSAGFTVAHEFMLFR